MVCLPFPAGWFMIVLPTWLCIYIYNCVYIYICMYVTPLKWPLILTFPILAIRCLCALQLGKLMRLHVLRHGQEEWKDPFSSALLGFVTHDSWLVHHVLQLLNNIVHTCLYIYIYNVYMCIYKMIVICIYIYIRCMYICNIMYICQYM